MSQIICPGCGQTIPVQYVHICPSCNYDILSYFNNINMELALSEIDRLSRSDATRHKNLKQNYVFLKKDIELINNMAYPDKPHYLYIYKSTDTLRMILEYLAFFIFGFMLCFLNKVFFIFETALFIFYPVYIIMTNHKKMVVLRYKYQDATNDWNGYKQKLILARIHGYSEKGITSKR